MKILIVGDSFAADWSVTTVTPTGWPNLLAEQVSVTNLARAGCSQYRIIQQLQSVSLDEFDWVVVCHTSPHRIVTRQHPIHQTALHASADLIFSDLEYHQQQVGGVDNVSLVCAYNFFRYRYDEDFQNFVYDAVLRSIAEILKNRNHIVIRTPLVPERVPADITILPQDVQKNAANHLGNAANLDVYQQICTMIHA